MHLGPFDPCRGSSARTRTDFEGGAMSRWKSRPLAVVALTSSLAALTLWTGVACCDSEPQRRTLAGLRSVHVQLELHGDDLAKFDVTEPVLRPEIESRLQAAGI